MTAIVGLRGRLRDAILRDIVASGGGFLLSFFGLQSFPVSQHFRRGISFDIAEYVRMPVHEFCREPIKDVIDGKRSLLLGHLRIKHDLQQQVPEFGGQFGPIAIVDGFENFVGFLKYIRLDGIESLLSIPRTSAWRAQALHDGDRALQTFSRSWHPATTLNDPT